MSGAQAGASPDVAQSKVFPHTNVTQFSLSNSMPPFFATFTPERQAAPATVHIYPFPNFESGPVATKVREVSG